MNQMTPDDLIIFINEDRWLIIYKDIAEHLQQIFQNLANWLYTFYLTYKWSQNHVFTMNKVIFNNLWKMYEGCPIKKWYWDQKNYKWTWVLFKFVLFFPIDSIVHSWSDLLSYLDSRQNEQSLSMACIRLP